MSDDDDDPSVADDMIDGLNCSHCGLFFAQEHGYPVLCESCFRADRGRSGYQKAIFPEADDE